LRIISGKYGGRHFTVPKNFKARPTTDFAKENLFNILLNICELQEAEVLDLFAGTGSISLEFASRGARQVVSVESDFKASKHIQGTVKQMDIPEIQVYRADVFRFLKSYNKKFDIVFADPPYAMAGISELPNTILQTGVLKNNGICIVEHGSDMSFTDIQGFKESRKYGSVHFSIFINPFKEN